MVAYQVLARRRSLEWLICRLTMENYYGKGDRVILSFAIQRIDLTSKRLACQLLAVPPLALSEYAAQDCGVYACGFSVEVVCSL